MKKSIILLSMSLIVSLVGCDKNNPSTSEVNEETFAFVDESKLLYVGDTYQLQFTNGVDMLLTNLSSSNESVAKVDQYGLVTALQNGSATITASYDDLVATCLINVSLGEYIPVIELVNIEDNKITIKNGDVFTIDAKVSANAQSFDFDATYVVNDESEVITLTDNVITANKVGTTSITIGGNFGDYPLDEVVVDITVIDSVQISLKSGDTYIDCINLYTRESFGGKEYPTTFTPTFEVLFNGKTNKSYVARVINNDGVVKFAFLDQTITALKAGTCAYQVSLTVGGNTYEKTFPISVDKPIAEFGETIFETDMKSGEIDGETIFASETNKEIVNATSVDGKKEYTISDGKITNLDYNDDPYQIIVYNDSCGYIVNVKVHTLIIRTAKDLEYFHCGDYGSDITESSKIQFNGSYILANDIDATTYVHKSHVRFTGEAYDGRTSCGLMGTFDGRGHTINGITLGDGGLFGRINSGTVKNVAFTNVKYNNVNNYYGETWVLAAYIYNSKINNVYINVPTFYKVGGTDHGQDVAGLAHDIATNSTVNNVVVSVGTIKDTVADYGVFQSFCKDYKSMPTTWMKDCYAISNYPLARFYASTDKKVIILDAGNKVISASCDVAVSLNNVRRYADVNEMNAAKNDYSSFNEYWTWDVSSGKLSFTSAQKYL